MRGKIYRRLDKLYARAERIPNEGKFLFFSDLHMGGGGPADDFAPNADLFKKVIDEHEGWIKICVGDAYDLWQFRWEDITKTHDVDVANFFVEGNHDKQTIWPCYIIKADPPIFVIHGHQSGDWLNYGLWRVSRFFVRYIWKPLEYLGIKDPPSSQKGVRHDRSRRKLKRWANDRGITVIAGHTHYQEHEGNYWNCGSSINPGVIEFIEFKENTLCLKQYSQPTTL